MGQHIPIISFTNIILYIVDDEMVVKKHLPINIQCEHFLMCQVRLNICSIYKYEHRSSINA